jgi:DNA replication protein DnaC
VLWATKFVATIIRCSISASQSCSRSWRQCTATGVMHEILSSLGNLQLLIIDDCGLSPVDADARHDLLEILEER